jgi:hypothetical protein
MDNISLLETNRKIDVLEQNIFDKQKNIEKTKEQIKKMEEEITILQEELDLEKLQIKYGIELVVDNVKQYEGNNHSGGKIKLETHCTIIRVKNSPESVHFGHVTLVYYYDEHDDNKTIRWHYGTKVNTEILPKDLTSDFWYSDNTYDPSTTKVGTFGTFNRIKKDVKLEEIMLYNFEKCVEFFNTKKSQWPKQVWNDYDMIGSEKATDVLQRLITVNKRRESIDYNSHMSKLKEKRDIIKKEIKRERKVNKQARKQQEQEEEQEHASLLVNTPEEIEALNIQRELAKKEFEKLNIQKELKQQETEAIERQQETERQLALANAKKQNGEELVPDKEKEAKEKEEKEAREKQRQREQKEAKKQREIEAKKQKEIQEKNKALEEQRILDELPPTTDALVKVDEPKKSKLTRKELTQKFVSSFFEEIDKDIQKANETESKISILDTDDKIDYDKKVYQIRAEVYDICVASIDKIDNIKIDNPKYRLLSHEERINFLKQLDRYKDHLETKVSQLLKINKLEQLDILKEEYTVSILPMEEKLKTLDPKGYEANQTKSYLTEFYKYFHSTTHEWLFRDKGSLNDEDHQDVRGQIVAFIVKVKQNSDLF